MTVLDSASAEQVIVTLNRDIPCWCTAISEVSCVVWSPTGEGLDQRLGDETVMVCGVDTASEMQVGLKLDSDFAKSSTDSGRRGAFRSRGSGHSDSANNEQSVLQTFCVAQSMKPKRTVMRRRCHGILQAEAFFN